MPSQTSITLTNCSYAPHFHTSLILLHSETISVCYCLGIGRHAHRLLFILFRFYFNAVKIRSAVQWRKSGVLSLGKNWTCAIHRHFPCGPRQLTTQCPPLKHNDAPTLATKSKVRVPTETSKVLMAEGQLMAGGLQTQTIEMTD